MSAKGRGAAPLVAGSAVVLGVAGDLLIDRADLGLNVFLWFLLLGAAWWRLGGRGTASALGPRAVAAGRLLCLVVLALSAGFLWRASPPLQAMDLLAIVAVTALAVTCASSGGLRRASVAEFAWRGILGAAAILAGPVQLLLKDVAWRDMRERGALPAVGAVGRGLLVAVPLVLVFGGLFMAGDAVFRHLVISVFGTDAEELLGHLLRVGFFAWIAAGTLRAAAIAAFPRLDEDRPQGLSLGPVEAATVLAVLDALFLSFVVVQFRYLFGGEALVQATAGLTYASYARSGFFVLIVAAALVLPTVVAGHWLLRKDDPAAERPFRALAWPLLAMVAVVMASAAFRLWLYVAAYGLTESRLFASAFMLWLLATFAWLGLTVLRGRRDRFTSGAAVAALLALAAMHAVNPGALIVRTNIALSEATGRFDGEYAVSLLGPDAVPALVAGIGRIPEPERARVAAALLEIYADGDGARGGGAATSDWRSWNWGDWTASRAVRAHLAELRTQADEALRP